MAGLRGSSPGEVFQTFRNHVNSLLHRTICEIGLKGNQGYISFRQADSAIAAKLRSGGWYLYLGQTLGAVKEAHRTWRLRTLSYSYRIQRGPRQDEPYLFRFEYESREMVERLHPRRHLHVPVKLPVPNTRREINLDKVHVPTGWVTIEELLRFLIRGLGVRSRSSELGPDPSSE